MLCADCPFHLPCNMGRLGKEGGGLVVCPKCEQMMLVLEQKYEVIEDEDAIYPREEQFVTVRNVFDTAGDVDNTRLPPVRIVADESVDPETMFVTMDGKRVVTRLDGKKIAHVVWLSCELRPMTDKWRRAYQEMELMELEAAQRTGARQLVVVKVATPDPGPGFAPVTVMKCMGCAGQFARAHLYHKVCTYNLDAGEKLPVLDGVAGDDRIGWRK